MAQRKPYNPNTKYGRRKLREQAAQNYERMTPAERSEHNQLGCIVMIIIIAIVFIIFAATGNIGGFFKWLGR